MGHVVSADGIQTDPDKIRSVRDFEVPTTVKKLKSFLGLAGYYRRFINGFSKIATPLHTLTKQFTAHPRKFIGNKWNSDCQQSFDTLKDQYLVMPITANHLFLKQMSVCRVWVLFCPNIVMDN